MWIVVVVFGTAQVDGAHGADGRVVVVLVVCAAISLGIHRLDIYLLQLNFWQGWHLGHGFELLLNFLDLFQLHLNILFDVLFLLGGFLFENEGLRALYCLVIFIFLFKSFLSNTIIFQI